MQDGEEGGEGRPEQTPFSLEELQLLAQRPGGKPKQKGPCVLCHTLRSTSWRKHYLVEGTICNKCYCRTTRLVKQQGKAPASQGGAIRQVASPSNSGVSPLQPPAKRHHAAARALPPRPAAASPAAPGAPLHVQPQRPVAPQLPHLQAAAPVAAAGGAHAAAAHPGGLDNLLETLQGLLQVQGTVPGASPAEEGALLQQASWLLPLLSADLGLGPALHHQLLPSYPPSALQLVLQHDLQLPAAGTPLQRQALAQHPAVQALVQQQQLKQQPPPPPPPQQQQQQPQLRQQPAAFMPLHQQLLALQRRQQAGASATACQEQPQGAGSAAGGAAASGSSADAPPSPAAAGASPLEKLQDECWRGAADPEEAARSASLAWDFCQQMLRGWQQQPLAVLPRAGLVLPGSGAAHPVGVLLLRVLLPAPGQEAGALATPSEGGTPSGAVPTLRILVYGTAGVLLECWDGPPADAGGGLHTHPILKEPCWRGCPEWGIVFPRDKQEQSPDLRLFKAMTRAPMEALAALRCPPAGPAPASGGAAPLLLQPLHQTVRHAQRQLRALPEGAAQGQEGSTQRASPPMATTIELKVNLGGPTSSAPPPAGGPAAPGGGGSTGGGSSGGGGGYNAGSQPAGPSAARPDAGGTHPATGNPYTAPAPPPAPASSMAAPLSLAGPQQLGSAGGTAPLTALLASMAPVAPLHAPHADPGTSPRTSALLAGLSSLASLNSIGSLPSSAPSSVPSGAALSGSSSLSGLLSTLSGLIHGSGRAGAQAGTAAAAALAPLAQ